MNKKIKTVFTLVYVVSCGEGINGEHLVNSALMQFPQNEVTVVKIPNVRRSAQIESVVDKARDTGGIIVHTLVDPALRKILTQLALDHGVIEIDAMGRLLTNLEKVLQTTPVCKPGLYRQIHKIDLAQVKAIEFALAHDDGLNPYNLDKSEIVVVGLSRAGKTPLSMFLSVLGWKVANVPLVIGIPLPKEIDLVDPRRIIALMINPDQLLSHRKMRQRGLGASADGKYSLPAKVFEEVQAAQHIFKKRNYTTINVSNKPIETSADEIIEIITRRFKEKAHIR